MKSKQHLTSRGTVSIVVIGATATGLGLTVIAAITFHISPLAMILVRVVA